MRQAADKVWKSGTGEIELFTYPANTDSAKSGWELWGAIEIEESKDRENCVAEPSSKNPSAQSAENVASEEKLAEEKRCSFESGRQQGFQEGQAAAREVGGADAREKENLRAELIARLTEDFQLERNRYFDAVEHEVVKLALAIAARILRREAQMDPLLLTGAVRVALGQFSASTEVRLRVPAADLEMWKETMAHLPNLPVRPAVVAGDDMQVGDCRMESELGSVDLGIQAQLGQIERGFFDRTEHNNYGQARMDGKELTV